VANEKTKVENIIVVIYDSLKGKLLLDRVAVEGAFDPAIY